MKAQITSFWEWQQHYPDNEACLAELATLRWPEGFQCPKCGHDQGGLLPSRNFLNVHTAIIRVLD